MKNSIFIALTIMVIALPSFAQDSTSHKELTIQSGDYQLGATLDLPAQKGPHPVVLIVPGSGPVDRTGDVPKTKTLEPKMYEEWGHALAANNIACLRYDKRALQIGLKDIFTFSQEMQIDDVVAAIKHLKQQPEIDSQKVYLLGHSEGGNLVLEAALQQKVAGVFVWNATALPIDSLFMQQLELNVNLKEKRRKKVQASFDALRDGSFPDKGLIFGAGKPYWSQWIEMTEATSSTLGKLQCPVYVYLAEADENFPGETNAQNIARWKAMAQKYAHVSMHTFAGLDHRMAGETEATADQQPLPMLQKAILQTH